MEGLCLNMTIHPFCDRFGLATISLPVQDLLNYTAIDPMVQRKLSGMQRRKIANYLQERELDHVFFGPVTLSLRDVSQLGRDNGNLYLRHGSKLSILDGQHRILALGYVNEQMLKEVRRYEKKLAALKVKQRRQPESDEIREEAEQIEGLLEQLEKRRLDLMETELSVQMYVGLTEEEEKQLFGDINSKVQLVSKELGHSFDSTDPLNLVIQQVVDHNIYLKTAGVETRNTLTAFNKNFTCNSWLYSLANMLFSGRLQASYTLARQVRKSLPTYVEILHQFFNRLLPLMPEKPGLTQFATSYRLMQEGIALYVHQHIFKDGILQEDGFDCLSIFEDFDWTHQNEGLMNEFGKLDNGKLNLLHEKSLRKHMRLVDFFEKKYQAQNASSASA